MMNHDPYGMNSMKLEEAASKQTLIDLYKFGSFIVVVEVG
jgi:hypothetical protein